MNTTSVTFEKLSSGSNFTFTASLVDDENKTFSDACIIVIGSFMTDGEASVTPPTGNTTDPTNPTNTTNATDMTTMTTEPTGSIKGTSKSVIHMCIYLNLYCNYYIVWDQLYSRSYCQVKI